MRRIENIIITMIAIQMTVIDVPMAVFVVIQFPILVFTIILTPDHRYRLVNVPSVLLVCFHHSNGIICRLAERAQAFHPVDSVLAPCVVSMETIKDHTMAPAASKDGLQIQRSVHLKKSWLNL